MTTATTMDLGPATRALAEVVAGVGDDQLTRPTPCTQSTVADLLDHVDGFCQAFAAAATKTRLPGASAPHADGSRLADDWRNRIPQRLEELAEAWRAPDAWTGSAVAGGVEMPSQVMGLVALNEVVVHGWDIARATGQAYDCSPEMVEGALGFVRGAVAQNPEGSPGLFGPPVAGLDQARPLDQLIGLTGRDPAWGSVA